MLEKRFLLIAGFLTILGAGHARANPGSYGWTISTSSVDPHVNTRAAATLGVVTNYLWYACSTPAPGGPGGMSSADFTIVSTGPVLLATILQNGFLNAGTASALLLAVGGCPVGPIIAANLLILDLPGTLSFVPNAISGKFVTTDCAAGPTDHPFEWIGYSNLGGPPPSKGTAACAACDATLTMEGCDEFILPSQDPPPFPVTRDGDSLKVTLVFEDVGDLCDLSNFRAWGVEVEFDNADLTFVDGTRSAFIDSGDWPFFSAQQITGTNRVKVQAGVGQSGPDDPGAGPVEFATLCFVASDNQSTDADYTFTTTNFTDDFGTEPLFLQLDVQPDIHTVAVDLHGTGDVTLNGSLTAGDSQCAAETNFNLAGEGFDVVPAQCVSSNPPPPNECNKAPLERYEADVDCDGLVGLDDADVIFDAAACGLDIVTPEPCLAKIFAACPIPAGRLAASSYAPTNADRRVRLGDVRASGSDVVRIPLEIQGTGQLKSFTLDFAYPASLDILEVERAPVTQDWLGFGHGTPAPGSLRILGYDVYTVGLAEGEWTTLAYLVVRPNAEEASSGRFELVASWDDVEGVPLLGGDVTVAGGTGEGLPTEFALGVGRPNPSPGAVTIDYVVPAGPSRHVEISIFNVQGQLVRTLVDGAQVAGRHEAAWDGRDGSDHTVAAGAYFVRMNSGVFQQTHKLVQTR